MNVTMLDKMIFEGRKEETMRRAYMGNCQSNPRWTLQIDKNNTYHELKSCIEQHLGVQSENYVAHDFLCIKAWQVDL